MATTSISANNISVNKMTDSFFSILLIVLFMTCIVILFVKGVFSHDDILEKGFSSVISTSGDSGSAILYMKWKVLRNVNVKSANMTEVTEMLKGNKEKGDE